MRLWRPTGEAELRLVAASGRRAWPPRLAEQPIFYPVTSFAYAERIARDWNAAGGSLGFVTRFEVEDAVAVRYPIQAAGGRANSELWVPADDLPAFNAGIRGRIEVVAAYRNRVPVIASDALEGIGLDA